jgi:hypothetical protein
MIVMLEEQDAYFYQEEVGIQRQGQSLAELVDCLLNWSIAC